MLLRNLIRVSDSWLLGHLRPESAWFPHLQAEFAKPYMQALESFLQQQAAEGACIYPPVELCFNALNTTDLDRVRVVIIGQDPYHGPGQAQGLSFSVPPGIRVPPSLRNIFQEIQQDLGLPAPGHGCLGYWAQQGVLLLNAVLTVEQGKAGAHQGKGWETFTDQVIALLSEQSEHLVFLLWGSYAQKKGRSINRERHLVLESVHPSPLSAHRGFLGCRHFSRANEYLEQNGVKPVDWRLPPAEWLDERGFLKPRDQRQSQSEARLAIE